MNPLLLWIFLLSLFSKDKIQSHDITIPNYFKEEAASYPFYLNVRMHNNMSLSIRLPTKNPGNYQIVLGTNGLFSSEFISLFKISLNGKGHKELPFQIKKPNKQSRIFASIDFSIQEGDSYGNEYIDCHITVIGKKVNLLSPKNTVLFRQNFLEFGFRKR
ncbi:hypothetical protein [Leptospira mayottensis]|uniref:hypothetical protein n=1 Tax=Leptospira mayottensis TaxID=1137606 RepID=UPI000E35AFB2|nr:hypothetical protein [Leptospira mayottensis]AXR67326.1 hypothetical protein DPV73_04175 [Leptospira mayottensis]